MKLLKKCLITVFFLCANLDAALSVRLLEHAEAEGPEILLQDVALVEGDQSALKEALMKIPLGKVPVLGRSQLVSAFKIQRLLEKNFHFEERQKISLYGSQSYVSTKSRHVSSQEIKEFIQDWIQQQLQEGTEFSLQYLHLPDNFQMPMSDKSRLMIEHSSKRSIAGTHSLALRSTLAGKVMCASNVRLVTKLFARLPTLIAPLKRGQSLNRGHIDHQRVEITHASGMELRSPKELLGLIAKRDLSVGSFLFARDFERPILVSRGSLNRLIIVNGPVKMSLSGAKALSNGKEGQFILFSHPLNRKKTIRAQVLAKGLARMDL